MSTGIMALVSEHCHHHFFIEMPQNVVCAIWSAIDTILTLILLRGSRAYNYAPLENLFLTSFGVLEYILIRVWMKKKEDKL